MDFFSFDDAYIRRLLDGDPATVEHYFKYFNFFLRQTLHGRVPFSDIDDVIQDIHTRVWAYLKSGKEIRESGKFGAFVFRFRDNIVHERRRDRSTDGLEDIYSADADTLRDLLQKERDSQVTTMLDSLLRRDAAILRAVYIDERDKDEVCRELGIDRNYLRVLIYRALEKCRDKFEDL